MSEIKIRVDYKGSKEFKIVSMEKALEMLDGWYKDLDICREDLTEGNIILQTNFCYFEKVK